MSPDEKDKEVYRALGISPAVAGTAAYLGSEKLTSQLGEIPMSLAKAVEERTSIPIKSKKGTPLQEIAEFTRREAETIRDFAKAQGVKVPILAAPDAKSAYFAFEKLPLGGLLTPGEYITPRAHIGLRRTSLPSAMHEIGHASPVFGSHRLRRGLQNIARMFRPAGHGGPGGLPGEISRGALLANTVLKPSEESSKLRQVAYEHAPLLVGATFAPELIEEGRATAKALRGAQKAGVPMSKMLAELAPSFGTYVARAAAPILATVFAKKLVEALHSAAKENEKTAEVRAPGLLRTPASAAWRIGGTPPKPKTTNPKWGPTSKAKIMEPAKPPSNQAYYHDLLDSLYNPSRGIRLATGGAGGSG